MKENIAEAIQSFCVSKKWRLSLAESCTGGHLAASFTQVPGCSEYFLGSIVAYSNEMKMIVLGVDPYFLETYGAVSGPVVGQMAQGVLTLSRSDLSIAVSGIAGPNGGSREKPVGTIWAAIGSRDQEPFIWNFKVLGSRQEIIDKSVEIILSQFSKFIHTK